MSLKTRYQVWWVVNSAQAAAVERRVEDGGEDLFQGFFDYGSYDLQIGCNGIKFYVTFNYFKLIGFTFKFWLCITHSIILMPPHLGVALYILGKLHSR